MLNPFELWMLKQNLQYAKTEGIQKVLERLQSQGYERVAQAVKERTTMKRHTVKVSFANGDTLTTDINGTKEEVETYYLGKYKGGLIFNLGNGPEDNLQRTTQVEFLD